MCNKAPVMPSAATPVELPGAWYDLSGRVDAVRAISSCALSALPEGLEGLEYARINEAGALISAMMDILDLMAQDVVRMEEQLHA